MTEGRVRCGPSFRTLISMAAAVALAAACRPTGSGETPGRTSETPPAPAASLQGVLPQPLDQYAGEGGRDAFVREMRRYSDQWTGGVTEERDCSGSGCGSTRVELMGLNGSHHLNLDDIRDRSIVVGRMVNVGNSQESLYGLSILREIEAYYLVVERVDPGSTNPNRRAVLRLVGVPTDPARPLRIDPRGTRYLNDCGHTDDANPTVTEAAFTACLPKATRADTSAESVSMRRRARGWIACVHGCCEVGES